VIQGVEGGGSIVRRWQLAAMLRELREQAGLTQEQAVERLRAGDGRWSRSKLSRVEIREHNIKPREVEQIFAAYRISDKRKLESLRQLATAASEPGWWAGFSDDEVPASFRPLLSLESGLVARRDFQSQLVPGLLQTGEYTRAVIDAVNPGMFSPVEVERRVAARMVRQQIITKENAPQFHFIFDGTILHRIVGRKAVMRDQMRRLLDVSEHENVTIQVLPHDSGGSPGLEGPFSILSLPEPTPDIGYTEGPAGTAYIEDRARVRTLTMRFGMLAGAALPQADSLEAIAEAAERFL
jgi:transcriptional regulator with XRE-family HTH domain